MKTMKRRLLSLLLAVVMVCTLAPAGLATYTALANTTWDHYCTNYTNNHLYPQVVSSTACTTAGVVYYYCQACGAYGSAYSAATGHSLNTSTGRCYYCGEYMSGTAAVNTDNYVTIVPYSYSGTNGSTFTNTNQSITLQARINGTAADYYYTNIKWEILGSTYYDNGSDYFYGVTNSDYTFTVTPRVSSTTARSCTVMATVTDGYGYTHTAYYNLYLQIGSGISLTASVNDTYTFKNVSNSGTYSVADQLTNALYNIYLGNRTLSYVVFDNVSTNYGKLDNVTANTSVSASNFSSIQFTPTAKGAAVFRFTAYVNAGYGWGNEAQSCVLTITVSDAVSGGSVAFYGSIGDDVYLNSAEFDDYWASKYSGGTLNYVTFGSVTGGSLLDADGNSATINRSFYVSPTRTQYDLNGVHFRPNSTNAGKAATVSFTFTAHGENRNRTSVSSSGTVNIVYMSNSPSDIKYTVGSDGAVNLKAGDFAAAYQEATGSAAPSNMKIVLQDVPRNGTLSYTDSSKKSADVVRLTSSSIRSRNFTASGSGSNQIGDVAYTNSTNSTDTIEYIAYSGNTAKFKGKIVFTGKVVPADISVTYQSTGGQSVYFSWADFTGKNSALLGASKVRFSAPTNGTLYLNGGAFAASTELLVTQVSGVTYVPKAGSNAQETLTFTAMDTSSQTVGSGTVVITVTGNAAAAAPSGSTTASSGAATSASQFKDVKSDAWYYTYLDNLVRKGIMGGRGSGIFDPNGTMTYGEALKMVLEATGHSAVAVTGNDWAINYKNLAVQNNWISNDISLTAPISRLATAELIAKVLGLSKYTGESPFADTTDGYAGALYHTNPQIFIGDQNPYGGKPLFNPLENNVPRTTLTRAQVCTVIYRLNSYYQGAAGSTGGGSANTGSTATGNTGSSSSSSSTSTSGSLEINPATGLPYGT